MPRTSIFYHAKGIHFVKYMFVITAALSVFYLLQSLYYFSFRIQVNRRIKPMEQPLPEQIHPDGGDTIKSQAQLRDVNEYKEDQKDAGDALTVTHHLRDKVSSLEARKHRVQGFEDAVAFLKSYDLSKGPLYLLFMSNEENGKYWCPDCERAQPIVYDSFEASPSHNQLLEIRVGNRVEWKNEENNFRMDPIFYVDFIPTLLKWNGNNKTSHMLAEASCTNEKLLNYVFQVISAAKFRPSAVTEVIHSYEEMVHMLDGYHNEYPLFLQLISGVIEESSRMWCPYCDRAEIPVGHYFNHTAASNAKLVKAVVAETYDDWHNETNPFRTTKLFQVTGIPTMFRVHRKPDDSLQFVMYEFGFEEYDKLQTFFSAKE